MNKKGFTIVELVIVIAVIAILAAVLIPTFSSVVNKANESSALQAVRNAYTECQIALSASGLTLDEGTVFSDKNQEYFFELKNNTIEKTSKRTGDDLKKYATLENGVKIYGVTVTTVIGNNVDMGSGHKIVWFKDTQNGNKAISINVYDIDGNLFFSESGTLSSNTPGLRFSMWNTSQSLQKEDYKKTWGDTANVGTAKNCMSEKEAYGWYSYVLTYDNKTFTGVFYFDETYPEQATYSTTSNGNAADN